jgi:hypothetical protein
MRRITIHLEVEVHDPAEERSPDEIAAEFLRLAVDGHVLNAQYIRIPEFTAEEV